MTRRSVFLTATLCVASMLLPGVAGLSQISKPGAPPTLSMCSGLIRNPTLIGYTVDTEDARCCHGPTGSEHAFIVDTATQENREVGGDLNMQPRTTQFDSWMPCRQVAEIAVGTPETPAPPVVSKCGQSKCFEPNSKYDAYLVNVRTNDYWSPVWSGGPFDELTRQNLGLNPIYEGDKLKGYLMLANGTLLSMLPDGSAKTKAPIPSDGHGCSFSKQFLSCQVGNSIHIYDTHFQTIATINGPLTLPVGRWAPTGQGFLYLDGLRPGPHYVSYWSAKDKQTYHLGPNIDYDLDCEMNGNCFGFAWGSELPAWAPDGIRAYFSVPNHADPSKRILGWVDVTTPQQAAIFHPLTEKFGRSARYPSVSPDGKNVAFVSFSDNPKEGHIQLFVLRLADGKIKQVTHVPVGSIVSNPAWQ
jgi:hypothetical protein